MVRATKRRPAGLALIGVLVLFGCETGTLLEPQAVPDLPAFSLSPTELSIAVGESATITPTLVRSNGSAVNPNSLKWHSTDPSRATVSPNGVVTGVAPGKPAIIATSGRNADTTWVRVVERRTSRAGIVVSPDTVVLTWLNATAALKAEVRNDAGTLVADPGLQWKSLQPAIAQVDVMGVVTAKGAGVALIVVTAACCAGSDTAYARVSQVIDSVEIDPVDLSLSLGSTAKLKPLARDRGGSPVLGAAFAFRSGDDAIVRVSTDSVLSTRAEGATTVTASSGGHSANTSVKVTAAPKSDPPPSENPPPSADFPNQPAGMVKITEHRGSPWPSDWWLHNPGNHITTIQDGGAPVPSWSTVRYRFPEGHAGGTGVGMMGHGSGNAGSASNMKVGGQPVREVYVRVWIRYSNGWQNPEGMSKMFYTYQQTSTSRNVLHADLTGTGVQSSYGTKVTSEVTGQVANLSPNVKSVSIQPGVWYLYELFSRAASADGVNDGIVRWWINGTLVGQHTNLRRSHHPFTELHWNPVWGGGSSIPVQKTQYIDFNGLYLSGR
jgi:hypothetical protein